MPYKMVGGVARYQITQKSYTELIHCILSDQYMVFVDCGSQVA